MNFLVDNQLPVALAKRLTALFAAVESVLPSLTAALQAGNRVVEIRY